ncbi:g11009 [Coccomyxa viridis]|uniref:G11009 protein n=1 Tax=Coccomyxa viridis TaxID=1274662 RepID=A0ABP1G6V1_9CHLO
MKEYAQAAQAHDNTSPYFALKGGMDLGLCLISIKLNSAIFFDFDGAASITTCGVYLRKGNNAIEGVAFTHNVQLIPNGPEFIASEEAESTVLSPREFFQRRQPCSLSSSGSQQIHTGISVQAHDDVSVEASGCRTPSPAFSAVTPLSQHDIPRIEESEACHKDFPGSQPAAQPAAQHDASLQVNAILAP